MTGTAYPVTLLSPTAYVTSAGRYCWRATFSGDPANGIPGSSHAAASECFTVNPVRPSLATTAGPDVLLGGAINDSATLSGPTRQPADPVINLTGATGPAAGGSITFRLYAEGDCTTALHTSTAVAVSGDGTYQSPSYTLTAAGTYNWVATYSGSTPNTDGVTHNADCADPAEQVVVETAPSSLTSAQTWVPNDAVTVTAPAGGALTGTASFALYASSDCTGTALHTETAAVSGASPQTVTTSNTTAQSASGSFSWKVSYTSSNPAQRSIPASCHETSSLTISNGGTVTSP